MELARRLSGPAPVVSPWTDPFADVKDRVHKAVIGGLGPRVFNTETDTATLRERVVMDVTHELEGEAGIARSDRERLVRELTDDILGHGPLERLLADDTITIAAWSGRAGACRTRAPDSCVVR